ncbi:hypothetical protein [Lutibacter sp.]|uniref:hypothetical protein n=1 Tax=Lutibacter sp. TaxID=1925666 RepID=UPI0025C38B60|nr:hypothetical protein [Lutibacter sp.]MCF6166993.1 hypothetical protein [Lutibacter sp.]
MKKLIIVLFLTNLILTSCSNIDTSPIIPVDSAPTEENIAGLISQNTTWTNDKIWVLNNKVVVEDGVTLTIEKGTIIKGKEGSGSLATALIIARGGKINAVGTPDQPIIFTSINDNIQLGEKFGTNLTVNDNSLWGGVIILGKAKASLSGDVNEFQIEGIPASDAFGLYGGLDDTDNSGNFEYISIRHGGAEIGAGNEINGLTLGAVGSGTTIKNIEITGNLDDGVEFFGGTVSPSNILVWGQGDDGLDIDQGYSGTISNSMVIEGNTSDSALEIDGGEGIYQAQFTLNNITLKGNQNAPGGKYCDLRSGAEGHLNNIYAYDFKTTSYVRLKQDNVAQNYVDGKITFSNWEIVLPDGVAITDIFQDHSDSQVASNIATDATNWTTSVTAGSQTVGADLSVFNWTYANYQGAY